MFFSLARFLKSAAFLWFAGGGVTKAQETWTSLGAWGDGNDDYGNAVDSTSSGYCVVGNTTLGSGGSANAVAFYDKEGDLTKAFAFGGSGWETANAVVCDGATCYFTGSTTSYRGSSLGADDTFMAAFKTNGQQWGRVLSDIGGNTKYQTGRGICLASDGGPVAVGDTGDNHVLVYKFTKTGNVGFFIALKGPRNSEGHAIDRTSSGNFIFFAKIKNASGQWDLLIGQLSSNGASVSWTKVISGMGNVENPSGIVGDDGRIFFTCTVDGLGQGGKEGVFGVLSGSGDLEEAYTLGSSFDDEAKAIYQIDSNCLIISGRSDGHPMLVKVCEEVSGYVIEWSRLLDKTRTGIVNGLTKSFDDGVVTAGSTRDYGAGGSDIQLGITDVDGVIFDCIGGKGNPVFAEVTGNLTQPSITFSVQDRGNLYFISLTLSMSQPSIGARISHNQTCGGYIDPDRTTTPEQTTFAVTTLPNTTVPITTPATTLAITTLKAFTTQIIESTALALTTLSTTQSATTLVDVTTALLESSVAILTTTPAATSVGATAVVKLTTRLVDSTAEALTTNPAITTEIATTLADATTQLLESSVAVLTTAPQITREAATTVIDLTTQLAESTAVALTTNPAITTEVATTLAGVTTDLLASTVEALTTTPGITTVAATTVVDLTTQLFESTALALTTRSAVTTEMASTVAALTTQLAESTAVALTTNPAITTEMATTLADATTQLLESSVAVLTTTPEITTAAATTVVDLTTQLFESTALALTTHSAVTTEMASTVAALTTQLAESTAVALTTNSAITTEIATTLADATTQLLESSVAVLTTTPEITTAAATTVVDLTTQLFESTALALTTHSAVTTEIASTVAALTTQLAESTAVALTTNPAITTEIATTLADVTTQLLESSVAVLTTAPQITTEVATTVIDLTTQLAESTAVALTTNPAVTTEMATTLAGVTTDLLASTVEAFTTTPEITTAAATTVVDLTTQLFESTALALTTHSAVTTEMASTVADLTTQLAESTAVALTTNPAITTEMATTLAGVTTDLLASTVEALTTTPGITTVAATTVVDLTTQLFESTALALTTHSAVTTEMASTVAALTTQLAESTAVALTTNSAITTEMATTLAGVTTDLLASTVEALTTTPEVTTAAATTVVDLTTQLFESTALALTTHSAVTTEIASTVVALTTQLVESTAVALTTNPAITTEVATTLAGVTTQLLESSVAVLTTAPQITTEVATTVIDLTTQLAESTAVALTTNPAVTTEMATTLADATTQLLESSVAVLTTTPEVTTAAATTVVDLTTQLFESTALALTTHSAVTTEIASTVVALTTQLVESTAVALTTNPAITTEMATTLAGVTTQLLESSVAVLTTTDELTTEMATTVVELTTQVVESTAESLTTNPAITTEIATTLAGVTTQLLESSVAVLTTTDELTTEMATTVVELTTQVVESTAESLTTNPAITTEVATTLAGVTTQFLESSVAVLTTTPGITTAAATTVVDLTTQLVASTAEALTANSATTEVATTLAGVTTDLLASTVEALTTTPQITTEVATTVVALTTQLIEGSSFTLKTTPAVTTTELATTIANLTTQLLDGSSVSTIHTTLTTLLANTTADVSASTVSKIPVEWSSTISSLSTSLISAITLPTDQAPAPAPDIGNGNASPGSSELEQSLGMSIGAFVAMVSAIVVLLVVASVTTTIAILRRNKKRSARITPISETKLGKRGKRDPLEAAEMGLASGTKDSASGRHHPSVEHMNVSAHDLAMLEDSENVVAAVAQKPNDVRRRGVRQNEATGIDQVSKEKPHSEKVGLGIIDEVLYEGAVADTASHILSSDKQPLNESKLELAETHSLSLGNVVMPDLVEPGEAEVPSAQEKRSVQNQQEAAAASIVTDSGESANKRSRRQGGEGKVGMSARHHRLPADTTDASDHAGSSIDQPLNEGKKVDKEQRSSRRRSLRRQGSEGKVGMSARHHRLPADTTDASDHAGSSIDQPLNEGKKVNKEQRSSRRRSLRRQGSEGKVGMSARHHRLPADTTDALDHAGSSIDQPLNEGKKVNKEQRSNRRRSPRRQGGEGKVGMSARHHRLPADDTGAADQQAVDPTLQENHAMGLGNVIMPDLVDPGEAEAPSVQEKRSVQSEQEADAASIVGVDSEQVEPDLAPVEHQEPLLTRERVSVPYVNALGDKVLSKRSQSKREAKTGGRSLQEGKQGGGTKDSKQHGRDGSASPQRRPSRRAKKQAESKQVMKAESALADFNHLNAWAVDVASEGELVFNTAQEHSGVSAWQQRYDDCDVVGAKDQAGNTVDLSKCTPEALYCAAIQSPNDLSEHAKAILSGKRGLSDPNGQRDGDGATAVWLASRRGNWKILSDFFKYRGVIGVDSEGQQGDKDFYDFLADEALNTGGGGDGGGEASTPKQLFDVNKPNAKGFSPLYIALHQRALPQSQREYPDATDEDLDKTIKALLAHGADIDVIDAQGRSLLHLACQQGDASVVRLLLKYGANPRALDQDGWSPLYTLLYHGLILQANEAASSENCETIIGLLLGCDKTLMYHRGIGGRSLLDIACANKHLPIVKRLLPFEGIVNLPDDSGRTPLLHLLYRVHIVGDRHPANAQMIELLKQAGAKVDQADHYGWTFLHIACQQGDVDTVRSLMNGVQETLPTTYCGWHPIYIAALYRAKVLAANEQAKVAAYDQILKLLLESDCDAISRMHHGKTMLHLAMDPKLALVREWLMQLPSAHGFSEQDQLALRSHMGQGVADVIAWVQQKLCLNLKEPDQKALGALVENRNVKLIAWLKEQLAIDIAMYDPTKQAGLHQAIDRGSDALFAWLESDLGIVVTDFDAADQQALRTLADQSHAPIIEWLEERPTARDLSKDAQLALYPAVCKGAKAVVKWLDVHLSIHFDVLDERLRTALPETMRRRHRSVIEWLLMHGMQVDAKDVQGHSALHAATLLGDGQMVAYLLAQKANPRLPTADKETALTLAAHHGYREVVAALLSSDRTLVGHTYRDDQATALLCALRAGHAEVVDLLLDLGANTERSDHEDDLVWLASSLDHTGVVDVLLAHGLCPQSNMGTALHQAVFRNDEKAVQCVLASKQGSAFLNERNEYRGDTALIVAAQAKSPKMAALLMQHKADIGVSNKRGMTALHIAAQLGSAELLKTLLLGATNVDVPSTKFSKVTPLYVAAQQSRAECVAMLLAAKAMVNAVNAKGYGPLHALLGRLRPNMNASFFDTLDTLLAAKADPNQLGGRDKGIAPIHLAAQNAVPWPGSRAKNDDQHDALGWTPASVAAFFGNDSALTWLRPHALMQSGHDVLFVAAQQGHARCVQALLEQQSVGDDQSDAAASSAIGWNIPRAMYVAIQQGHMHVVEQLLPYIDPQSEFAGCSIYQVACCALSWREALVMYAWSALGRNGLYARRSQFHVPGRVPPEGWVVHPDFSYLVQPTVGTLEPSDMLNHCVRIKTATRPKPLSAWFEEGRVPAYICPDGHIASKVMLKGVLELLAITRVFNGHDVFGNGALGLIPESKDNKIRQLRLVQLRAGDGFDFTPSDRTASDDRDPKDIPYAPGQYIAWSGLLKKQQERFSMLLHYYIRAINLRTVCKRVKGPGLDDFLATMGGNLKVQAKHLPVTMCTDALRKGWGEHLKALATTYQLNLKKSLKPPKKDPLFKPEQHGAMTCSMRDVKRSAPPT